MPRLLRLLAVALSALLFVPAAAYAEVGDDGADKHHEKADAEDTKKKRGDTVAEKEEKKADKAEKAKKDKRNRWTKPVLDCKAKLVEDQLNAVCSWEVSDHAAFAGWKLIRRGGGEGRVVVAKGDANDDAKVLDGDIAYNKTYRYRLILTGEDGNRVRASKFDRVRAKRPRFERLTLECFAHQDEDDKGENDSEEPEDNQGDVATTELPEEETQEEAEENNEGPTAVVCEWNEAEYGDVVTYQLLRKLPGEKRSVVAEGEAIAELRFEDELEEGIHHAKYRLRTLDESGRRIGKSKVAHVRMGS